jgi:hypothetical protein
MYSGEGGFSSYISKQIKKSVEPVRQNVAPSIPHEESKKSHEELMDDPHRVPQIKPNKKKDYSNATIQDIIADTPPVTDVIKYFRAKVDKLVKDIDDQDNILD